MPGPRTYLGLMTSGYPSLFIVCGPQSPSVMSNMLTHLRDRRLSRMEARVESEDNWVNTTNDLADLTLMPQAALWYIGASIPGKRRVFMPFVGGVGL